MPDLRQARSQVCPNCQTSHDIAVYVSGQKLRCRCGIHFEVRRTDVPVGQRPSGVPTTLGRRISMVVAQGGTRAGETEAGPADPSLPLKPPPMAAAPQRPGEAEPTFISPVGKVELPGYELLEVVGRGGMGEVWRAHQKSLGRTVAVKVLPPKLAKDPEFIARFEKEATALAALNHPHIVQIMDRGVCGDHYYFVMEFVAGSSLRDLINAGRVPVPEALQIAVQICQAIDYAHGKQIIHRDLKPENILIDESGRVKVADFGLAGIGGPDSKHQLTATSVAMGTVNYMAPEQRRDAKHVDHRADLYSLGVMLYELVTGELPIGRFKLPSERIAGTDSRLDVILARTLETDPETRYQRAAELGAALGAMLGLPVEGAAPTLLAAPRANPRLDGGPSESVVNPSVLERGWNGFKIGLMVIGALVVLAGLLKLLPAGEPAVSNAPPPAPPVYPPNTEGELGVASSWAERPEGGAALAVGFDPGEEEMNAHAGDWQLKDGKLQATQAGNHTGDDDHLRLIPRAYFAHRYFSADDLSAEVEVRVEDLGAEFPMDEEAQRFAELAFRIKDLQVSIFAIPGAGMRLGWRYFTPDGLEQAGNSSRDLENMLEDETPVPRGAFRVKLLSRKTKNAVHVEAFVKGQRFAHKILPGLEGQTGKIALGCRNLRCEFDDLKVTGRPMPRPAQKKPQ